MDVLPGLYVPAGIGPTGELIRFWLKSGNRKSWSPATSVAVLFGPKTATNEIFKLFTTKNTTRRLLLDRAFDQAELRT
jgi:hypothetical protein